MMAGTIYYDGDCSLCTELVARFERPLSRHGWALVPLQSPGVAQTLGIDPAELLDEMRVRTYDGRLYGGADAVVHLARGIWWAWPLVVIAALPGGRRILRAGYRRVAARRYGSGHTCSLDQRPGNR